MLKAIIARHYSYQMQAEESHCLYKPHTLMCVKQTDNIWLSVVSKVYIGKVLCLINQTTCIVE